MEAKKTVMHDVDLIELKYLMHHVKKNCNYNLFYIFLSSSLEQDEQHHKFFFPPTYKKNKKKKMPAG